MECASALALSTFARQATKVNVQGRATRVTGFGVAAAAFVCSLPALAALARSDIQGSLRYLLMAAHTLWFMIGGLYVLFVIIPPRFLW